MANTELLSMKCVLYVQHILNYFHCFCTVQLKLYQFKLFCTTSKTNCSKVKIKLQQVYCPDCLNELFNFFIPNILPSTSSCSSIRLHSGFMCLCFRLKVPHTISPLLTFCSFSLQISNKLILTSSNSHRTALFTLAIAKISLGIFFYKIKIKKWNQIINVFGIKFW